MFSVDVFTNSHCGHFAPSFRGYRRSVRTLVESRQLESEKCVTPGVAPDVTAPGMTEYMCYQLCTFEVSEGDRWGEAPLPPVDVLCWYLNSSTDRDVFVRSLIP